MKFILIVGIGNMGKAHYEAISRVQIKKKIYLFDKIINQNNSIELINDKYNQSEICKSIDLIRNKIDLLILSTTAESRYSALIKILQQVKVDKILFEKFLFQNFDHYKKVETILNKRKIKSWVHLPLRINPFFKKIKREITKYNIFNLRSIGGDWSMSTNIVHTLDLFIFLTGSKEIKILNKYFDKKKIHSKKRKKYDDVNGFVFMKAKSNHFLEISKDKYSSRPKEFEFLTKKSHYIISKNNLYSRNLDNWEFIVNKFEFPYLSTIGKKLLGDMLISGKSNLPTYNEALISHKLVFELFSHIKKNNILNIT